MTGFRRTRPRHLTQPDSIVPGAGDALAWDWYAYVNYNPLKYTDSDGHIALLAIAAIVVGVGLIAGAIDAAIQHHNTGSVDLAQTATVAGIATGGAALVAGGLAVAGVITVTAGATAATAVTAGTSAATLAASNGIEDENLAIQQGANVVTEFADDAVSLYRAVSEGEAIELLNGEGFRTTVNAMEGKWFWQTLESAQNYVTKFPDYAYIIEAQVQSTVLNLGEVNLNLDSVGKAIYFAPDMLQKLNDAIIRIMATPK